jgi:hypothetical protein
MWEMNMSNLNYAIVETETEIISGATQATAEQAKPFLVSDESERSGNWFTSRVQAALDAELANGSMPA